MRLEDILDKSPSFRSTLRILAANRSTGYLISLEADVEKHRKGKYNIRSQYI